MIEVEYRVFIDEPTFKRLETDFLQNYQFFGKEKQITYYLNHEIDTRIQLSSKQARLWQKLGKIHDVARSEIEILIPRIDGEKLLDIFSNLGYGIKVVWFRERKSFKTNSINIELDNTVGYGLILEAEIICDESEVENAKVELLNFFRKYNLSISSNEVLNNAFNIYKENWVSLTHGLDASWLSI